MASALKTLEHSGPMPGGPAPDSAPIDLVYLSHQTLGDRALEIELLSLFTRQAGHILAQLQTPANATVRPQDLAHTLTGSARAIGACAVAKASQHYEMQLDAGGPGANAALDRLGAAIGQARAAIGDLLEDR